MPPLSAQRLWNSSSSKPRVNGSIEEQTGRPTTRLEAPKSERLLGSASTTIVTPHLGYDQASNLSVTFCFVAGNWHESGIASYSGSVSLSIKRLTRLRGNAKFRISWSLVNRKWL